MNRGINAFTGTESLALLAAVTLLAFLALTDAAPTEHAGGDGRTFIFGPPSSHAPPDLVALPPGGTDADFDGLNDA